MSDEIVARLRDIEGGYGFRAICREAADEIERLRLELAIPRDEYAREWKTLLDRIEHLDILEWIRAYAAAHSPSDYVSPIAREVIVRSDKKLIQAADEIERLRAGGCSRGQTTTQFCAEAEQLRSERDEARRRVCTDSLQLGQVYRRVGGQSVRVTTPEAVAEMMGWRCFEDIAARCGDGGAGAHTAGPTETFIPEAL